MGDGKHATKNMQNRTGGEVGMSATEKVVNDLNVSKLMLCNPKMLTSEMYVRIGQAINGAIDLLKEQEPKPMIEIEDDDLYAWSPKDISYYCPRPECGKEISYDYNFCPYCGQAVKLDDDCNID